MQFAQLQCAITRTYTSPHKRLKRGVVSGLSAILEVNLYTKGSFGSKRLSVIVNWEVVHSSEVRKLCTKTMVNSIRAMAFVRYIVGGRSSRRVRFGKFHCISTT